MPTIINRHTSMRSLWTLFTDEIFQRIKAAAETFYRPLMDLKMASGQASWTRSLVDNAQGSQPAAHMLRSSSCWFPFAGHPFPLKITKPHCPLAFFESYMVQSVWRKESAAAGTDQGSSPSMMATWSFWSFQNLFVKFVEVIAHNCHREISL